MPVIFLKDLLKETSIWAHGTGMGSKAAHYTTKTMGKKSSTKYPKSDKGKKYESDEYTLTPEEETMLVTMDDKQRYAFHKRKLRQARREKGLCQRCRAELHVGSGEKQPKYCTLCAAEDQRYKKEARAKNLCPQCYVNPLATKDDGSRAAACQPCLDRIAKLHSDFVKRKYTDKGICKHCYKNPVEIRPDGTKYSTCSICRRAVSQRRRETLPIDYSIE